MDIQSNRVISAVKVIYVRLEIPFWIFLNCLYSFLLEDLKKKKTGWLA
jgi:hypothetical protein